MWKQLKIPNVGNESETDNNNQDNKNREKKKLI